MSIPKQVKKQVEDVQRLYEELNGGAVEEVPTDDVAQDEAPAEDGQSEVEETQDTEETFEQKYRSLQGMYSSKVTQVQAQNAELVQRLGGMEQLISTMSATTDDAKTKEESKPTKLISEEDTAEYGESIAIMRKAAREEMFQSDKRLEELEEAFAQVRANVGRVETIAQAQTQTSEQLFWTKLHELMPTWQEVNDNQDFKTWLVAIDPMTGAVRQALLEDAQRQYDAARVASFFSAWQATSGAAVKATAQNDPQAELKAQLSPGKGRTTAPAKGVEPKTYSTEDIAKFFAAVRAGKYVGKETERDTTERDIFAAQQDGRITNA